MSRAEKSRTRTTGLRRLIRPFRGRISMLAIVSFASAAMEALFIVILTAIAMALVGGETTVGPVFDRHFALSVALMIAGLALIFRVLFSLVGVWISASLTALVTTIQRQRLARAYLRASWAVQQSQPAGQLQALLTDFVNRTTNTIETFTKAISAALSLFALLATGVAIDPLATGAVLVALAVVGGVLTPLRRAIRRRSSRNSEANLEFAKSVSELGSLGQEMQTFGVGSKFEEQIDEWTELTTETQRKTKHLQGALPHVYSSLAYAAVLVGVAILPQIGIANLTAIGAVVLLMLRSLSYGQQLATASASLAANQPFLDRVESTLAFYSANEARGGSLLPEGVAPIRVDNVSFSYTPKQAALHNLTFELAQGEAVGVIGPSGAGKSTLAQLLLGLRPPDTGDLRVTGVSLNDVDRAWWSQRVAFVAQDALLFTGTVAENIRFFRQGISDSDLRVAAQQANFLKDIEDLPEGFDTHLGERGGQLSGGQKQRLSIARALAGKPELLILDEPTSALDGQSEALIRQTLMNLRGDLSIVIIAHRMSTLDVCDRIMVIESGRITAFDTPDQLLNHSDFYRTAISVAGMG